MKTLLIALGAVVALWAAVTLMLFVTGRRSSARELATFVPNLVSSFAGCWVILWYRGGRRSGWVSASRGSPHL